MKKCRPAGSPLCPASSCADKCHFPVFGFLSPSRQISPEGQGEGLARFSVGARCLGTVKGWCRRWAFGMSPRKSLPNANTPLPTLPGFSHVTLPTLARPYGVAVGPAQLLLMCSVRDCCHGTLKIRMSWTS